MCPVYPGYEAYKQQRYREALTLAEPVAERGNADAQTLVGSLYQLGLGVAVDEAKAIAWYEKASAQGYGLATNNLATMFSVQGQIEESKQLYHLAKEQGFEHTPASAQMN